MPWRSGRVPASLITSHVHAGALGWNAFLSFGILYWVVPRLWKTPLYSTRLATVHFWIATVGLITYQVSMWVAGITQWGMWAARSKPDGRLSYPDFIETVIRIVPRLLGPAHRRPPVLLGRAAPRVEHRQDDPQRAGQLRRRAGGARAAARAGHGGAGCRHASQYLRLRVLPAPARAEPRRPPGPRVAARPVHSPRRWRCPSARSSWRSRCSSTSRTSRRSRA